MKKILLFMLSLIVSVGVSAETTSVWSGNYTFPENNGWQSVDASKFTDLKLGDKLVVTVSAVTEGQTAQINLAGNEGNNWQQVTGTGWSEITVGQHSYIIDKDAVLKSIKAGGLAIQGKYYTLTDISIEPCQKPYFELNHESTLTMSETNNENVYSINGDIFKKLDDNAKITFTVTRTSEVPSDKDWLWSKTIDFPNNNWDQIANTGGTHVSEETNTFTTTASEFERSIVNDGNIYLNFGCDETYKSVISLSRNIKIEDNQITITITAAGIGSMILPFDAEVPEGMTVYKVGTYENNVLHLNSVNAIAANTPYIIKGTAKGYEFVGVAEAEYFQYTVAKLCGTYESILAPANSYVLQNGNEGAGFYPVVEGNEPTVTPYHAYLTSLPTAEKGAKLILDFDGEVTGIKTIDSKAADSRIYNLSGQLVNKAQKGIVVMNGKKYLIK